MQTTMAPLLGQSLLELKTWAQEQQQPAYRGQQIYNWIYQKGARSLTEITVLPKAWRSEMADYPVGRSEIVHRTLARDGTLKLLLQLQDQQVIETVGIPTRQRLTVCVSSQVGCPMACDFCATGKMGYKRNLAAHEILDQVLTIQEEFQRRVSHIVFMGMGEPLLNQEHVVQAVNHLNHDIGISQRHMTISTVGVPHQIRKLAERKLQTTLAVSLHAPNQELRQQLIPSAKHYPLDQLMADCLDYTHMTGRRLSFEYTLLGGVNDRNHHAHELATLVKGAKMGGLLAHVNLIPYNPISDADYQRPSPQQISIFLDQLCSLQIPASVRQTRGLDQNAACGQLRGSWTGASTPVLP
jgi:23S rRNA (adenine2503-C2)-methyltransferase